MGGAALRGALGSELGHRRPGRPLRALPLVGRGRGRVRAGEPAPRRRADLPPAAEPLLPHQPPLPQPPLPAHGGRARLGFRPRAGRRCRAGPDPAPPDRPARRVPPQAGRPRTLPGPRRRRPELRPLVPGSGRAARQLGHLLRLAERHGPDWRRWPSAYRRPDGPGADNFRGRYEDRVGLHQWLQWLLDRQLAAASAHLPLMHDLAVGFDPGGADAWQWQDLLAPDMAICAPPDAFNTKGQVWGLPPFDPWKLRAAGYEPFVETVRASVRHAGALRIDHALGLARLYWVPEGAGPTEGAYVRYPFGDLLDVIARESRAAGAYVVAEDLGTSTPEILDALAARRLLSYRLLWFEEDPPEVYPVQAMAAVTTHDLPTVAGLWTSS